MHPGGRNVVVVVESSDGQCCSMGGAARDCHPSPPQPPHLINEHHINKYETKYYTFQTRPYKRNHGKNVYLEIIIIIITGNALQDSSSYENQNGSESMVQDRSSTSLQHYEGLFSCVLEIRKEDI